MTAASLSATPNYLSTAAAYDSIPELTRKSVVANLTLDVTSKLNLFVDGYYSHRDFNSDQGGATMGGATPVPNTNPFYVNLDIAGNLDREKWMTTNGYHTCLSGPEQAS